MFSNFEGVRVREGVAKFNGRKNYRSGRDPFNGKTMDQIKAELLRKEQEEIERIEAEILQKGEVIISPSNDQIELSVRWQKWLLDRGDESSNIRFWKNGISVEQNEVQHFYAWDVIVAWLNYSK